jgi:hypothetical protein
MIFRPKFQSAPGQRRHLLHHRELFPRTLRPLRAEEDVHRFATQCLLSRHPLHHPRELDIALAPLANASARYDEFVPEFPQR